MTDNNNIKLETSSMSNAKVAPNAAGRTERHNAAAPAEHGKPSWLAIAIIGAIVLVGIGAIATFAGSNEAPAIAPTPTTPEVPAAKPMPTNNDTQNSNRNEADHGSVNINGDNNRVHIDNSSRTVHHHHHTTTTTPEPKVEPVVRTVLVRTTELRRDNVTPECNQHMADHHRKLAEWYDELAAGK
mgnify:CR=1 FL=1